MRLMDWLKSLWTGEPTPHPQARIFLSLREQRDAELEDARQRVARLLEEMEARDMRTHP